MLLGWERRPTWMLRHAEQKTTAESAWPTNSSVTIGIPSYDTERLRCLTVSETDPNATPHAPVSPAPPKCRHSWPPLTPSDQQP